MPTEVTVNARPMEGPPVDPNVHVPAHVSAAADAANAIHAAAYGPQPQPQNPQPQGTIQFAEPTYTPPTQPNQPWTPPATAQERRWRPLEPLQPGPEPAPAPDPKAAERANWTSEQWQHHALSMEGRLKKTRDELKTYQTEVVTLGDEVARSQQILRQQPQNPQQPQQSQRAFLTPTDTETYGPDMIDFARRAALDAVNPVLTNLQKQNEALQKRINRSSASSVESTLDSAVPNWREINTSPEFKAWLRLRDIYSREVKHDLLNKAYSAGDASTVAQFFKGYLAENPNQGEEYNPLLAPQPASQPATRPAGIPIETLTAPGHARPSMGQPVVDAGAPSFITHAQVAKFYDMARQADAGRGPYAGNAQARANDEAFIAEMARKGLVR